jgi:ribosomal protein S18 acetylase RimI-like enzyme
MIAYWLAGKTQDRGMRRFDLRRDLPHLADLIQAAFKAELESTGSNIVQELRQLARAGPALWLLGAGQSMLFRPWDGYVWIENGQVVGNATLSCTSRQRGVWAVHNVAVHPCYQGRGIARQLMQALLTLAGEANAQLMILEVQKQNLSAQRLYRRLGFEVYDTITELSQPAGHRDRSTPRTPPLHWRKRSTEDWRGLYDLACAATLPGVQEVTPLRSRNLRLGVDRRIERRIYRWLRRRSSEDWLVEANGRITAWVELVGQYRRGAHLLQMTVDPQSRGGLEAPLLAAGLDRLQRFPHRSVQAKASESHPEALQAYHQAGFTDVRVLELMQLPLSENRGGRGP